MSRRSNMSALPERVLLATDGSEDARNATHTAVDLVAKCGAELHVVHVWRDVPSPYARSFIKRELARQGQEILDAEVAAIEELGGEIAGAHLAGGRISDEVLRRAKTVGADLIVLGSRGRGAVGRLLLGSHAEDIVHRASCPVLIVRYGEENWPPEHVIAADDFSETATQATAMGISIGALYDAGATLLHAYPQLVRGESEFPVHEAERDLTARAESLPNTAGASAKTKLWEGDAAEGLIAAAWADRGNTLIVLGSRGLGPVGRARLGSTATKVVRAAPCPVLVYAASNEERSE
jgi:nucleotide-binding universal stress UspA family protein